MYVRLLSCRFQGTIHIASIVIFFDVTHFFLSVIPMMRVMAETHSFCLAEEPALPRNPDDIMDPADFLS